METGDIASTVHHGKLWVYDDGGRSLAGFKGDAGDCVTRAIAIATGIEYQEVYDSLFLQIKEFSKGRSRQARLIANKKSGRSGTTPRNGIPKKVTKNYIKSIGWVASVDYSGLTVEQALSRLDDER